MSELTAKVLEWGYMAAFIGIVILAVRLIFTGGVRAKWKELVGCVLVLFFLKYPDFLDVILLAFRTVIVSLLSDLGGMELQEISNPGIRGTPPPNPGGPGADLL